MNTDMSVFMVHMVSVHGITRPKSRHRYARIETPVLELGMKTPCVGFFLGFFLIT